MKLILTDKLEILELILAKIISKLNIKIRTKLKDCLDTIIWLDAFNHTSVKVVFQPHIIFTHMCPGLIKEHFVCQVWLHQHLHNIFKEAVWLDVIIFDVLYAS